MVLAFLLLLLGGTFGMTEAQLQTIGVCNGRVADNLPPPQEVVALYKDNGIGKMRIYDPDQATLEALRGSDIELMVGVPNEVINSLATDDAAASDWVQNNILNYPDVKFRYIVVGNEIDPVTDIRAQSILPAMQNIYTALPHANQKSQIKVSTAIQTGLLSSSYPPSAGEFSPASSEFIAPIAKFLADNGLPLLANVHPYFSYISDPSHNNLSYALLSSKEVTVKDGIYEYKNLFDASLDAIYAALEKVSAPYLEVVVSESGWPSDGDNAATIDNAQTYYNNLIMHVSDGTPKRPNKAIETYLFAMFDEDQKGPTERERHYGLFTPDKQPKYKLVNNTANDLTSNATSANHHPSTIRKTSRRLAIWRE